MTVKERINCAVKARLLRGAFYLLLLSGVCMIPFALGQQSAASSGHRIHANRGPTPTSTPAATPTSTCSICFTPTPTSTPTASPTPTATATPPSCVGQYVITQIGGSIVPGTTDIGNHSRGMVTTIPLPFSYTLYGTTFTSINLSTFGNAQFTTTDARGSNVCLPWSGHNATIFPYWTDLLTDARPGCSGYPGGTCGIYTSVSGNAPNRIFNIEWRTVYDDPPSNIARANFELRLYEGQTRFDVIYGEVFYGNNGSLGVTAGTQRDDSCFNQYFCNGVGGPASGGWTLVPVGTSPTPTPTPSPCAVTSQFCGGTVFVPPTDFIINVSGGVDPRTVDASDLMVNNLPANSFVLSNGNTTITFHFNSSPVTQPGVQTMHIPACAFNCGNGCIQEFNCTFTYQPSTPTPTPTATPTLTPRPSWTPRPRPTPAPRP